MRASSCAWAFPMLGPLSVMLGRSRGAGAQADHCPWLSIDVASLVVLDDGGAQCHPLAVDVSVLPPARSRYGEELLFAARSRARPRRMSNPRAASASPRSPIPAYIVGRLVLPRQLKLGKSSSLSPGVVREFGRRRQQMYRSSSSLATSALGKEVQEEGLRGRCPSQSSRT
jgi:hypothetical protein